MLVHAASLAAAPPPAHLPPSPRILLVRPDHLGDVLLASAGILALRRALPTAHLTLLAGPWSREIAERSAAVDEVLTCEFPGFSRGRKGAPWAPYLILTREAGRLRRLDYDLAIILRPDHWWGALLATAARIPIRLGYSTALTHAFLTHAEPLPARAHSVELGLVLAQRAAEIASSAAQNATRRPPPDVPGAGAQAGCSVATRGGDSSSHAAAAAPLPTFRLEDRDSATARTLLEQQGVGQQRYLVVHAGSGSPLKAWPAHRWATAADALRERLGAAVVLTGGHAEIGLVREVAAHMRRPAALLAGDVELGTLAAVLQRAELVLGADSGPLHLASALGTRTVRLYGPTDPARFGPWGSEHCSSVVRIQLPCSPCGNLVDPPCGARATPACMRGISVDQVLSAQRLLSDA
jgi:heptosyltransferase-2/heptosyltransferase-3